MKNNHEQELMNELHMRGKLELAEVVDMLQISESTARRLFTRMEREGKIIRVHGGIRLPGKYPTEYSFEHLVRNNLREKESIASIACDLLQNGEIIFCDTGTTVLCFCMELLRRIENTPMNLKVYTNSLANFEVLVPKVPVTLIGGDYRQHRKDFAGYLAETALEKVHFTKSFLGTDGCDGEKYFTTMDMDTARLDEIAMRNSAETVILCASDKFEYCAEIGYAQFQDVDRVITDSRISRKVQKALEVAGVEVIVV